MLALQPFALVSLFDVFALMSCASMCITFLALRVHTISALNVIAAIVIIDRMLAVLVDLIISDLVVLSDLRARSLHIAPVLSVLQVRSPLPLS